MHRAQCIGGKAAESMTTKLCINEVNIVFPML